MPNEWYDVTTDSSLGCKKKDLKLNKADLFSLFALLIQKGVAQFCLIYLVSFSVRDDGNHKSVQFGSYRENPPLEGKKRVR